MTIYGLFLTVLSSFAILYAQEMNNQLYIYDCLSASLHSSDGGFMTIGAGEKNTFRVMMRIENGGSFAQRHENCRFFPHGKVEKYSVNGVEMQADVVILPDTLYLIVLEGACLVCWYGRQPDFSQYNPDNWYLYSPDTEEWYGPYELTALPHMVDEFPADSLVSFQGLSNAAFYLRDVLQAAECAAELRNRTPRPESIQQQAPRELRCPSCWLTFKPEERLSIATHPELLGDPVLGEDEMLRFLPQSYDATHTFPLDSCGSPCTDRACPHCRLKLPPFFESTHQHIFSLVGVPAAGKTHYLATLVAELEKEFPREFGMPFRDADPTMNEPLSELKDRLFNARTPQDAYLGKTQLRGNLYQQVWRHGVFANVPRPFIYNLSKSNETHSIVLYDNAGEDFQPGSNSEYTPGSLHMAVADAILFLFDPTANPGFRTLLKDNQDPQIRNNLYRPGRQAILLAESEMRLRTKLNLPPSEKMNVPMAVIIGKCDTWAHLLGPEALLPATRNGMFMPEHININSARLRQFLFNVAPHICANAEAISSNVRYFAASALGSSPVEFRDEASGTTLIGPASGEIHPFRVTEPLLWALHQIAPSLIPGAHAG